MSHATPPANRQYIIVGGGTTGLLLANRLSASPLHTVTVIEPGPDDRDNPAVTNPFRLGEALNSKIDWAYNTTPQDEVGGRTLQYHAGKLVGGTSMINGLNYIRADASQIDAWEALGATGWNWRSMQPYYKRSEHFVRPSAAQQTRGATYDERFHGETGEVEVGWFETLGDEEFYGIMKDTWASINVRSRIDANGGTLGGFTVRPWTVDVKRGTRESAATAFYYPVAGRPNLRVLQGTVTKLLWEPSTEDGKHIAVGVEYLDDNSKTELLHLGGPGEVILSAGSLRSPSILEASGIGNPRILSKLGIETRVDLPGVGENLQDQANLLMTLKTKANVSGYTPYAAWVSARDLFGNSVEEVSELVQLAPPNQTNDVPANAS